MQSILRLTQLLLFLSTLRAAHGAHLLPAGGAQFLLNHVTTYLSLFINITFILFFCFVLPFVIYVYFLFCDVHAYLWFCHLQAIGLATFMFCFVSYKLLLISASSLTNYVYLFADYVQFLFCPLQTMLI